MRTLALLALLAGPAAAMTEQQCADSFEVAAGYLSAPFTFTLPAVLTDGRCEARGIVAEVSDALVLEIDNLRWEAGEVDRFIRDSLPPTSLTLEAAGLRLYARTGNPSLDYGLRLQAQPGSMRLELQADWDSDARQLIVEKASWSDGMGNAFDMTGTIADVDLATWASVAESVGRAGLSEASLTVQSTDLVEKYLAVPLATILLDDKSPPPAQIGALKALAAEAVAGVPPSILPAPSAAALDGLIADLPQPRGTLQLDISAEPSLGAARMAFLAIRGRPQTAAELWRAFEGVTLDIDWQPGAVE